MGWEFNGVIVPTSYLVDDWHRLVKLGCRKKVHFECVFPFLYVYPEIYQRYVASGWGADGLIPHGKTAVMRYSNPKKWNNHLEYCKRMSVSQEIWLQFHDRGGLAVSVVSQMSRQPSGRPGRLLNLEAPLGRAPWAPWGPLS